MGYPCVAKIDESSPTIDDNLAFTSLRLGHNSSL